MWGDEVEQVDDRRGHVLVDDALGRCDVLAEESQKRCEIGGGCKVCFLVAQSILDG